MRLIRIVSVPVLLVGLLSAGGKDDRAEKESNAVGTVRSINTAQAAYQSTYGFWACDLGQLLPGPAGSKPTPDHAGLLDPSVEDAKARGYSFMVMCPNDRADGYEVVAWPKEKKMRTFCSDTRTLLYVSEGDPNNCLKERKPLS